MTYINFQKPFKIVGADGTVYYEGAGKLGVVLEAKNPAADANGIANGGCCMMDTTVANTVVAGPYPPSGAEYVEELSVLRVAAAASVGLIGVALGAFAAGGDSGLIASSGSVLAVRCTSAAIAVGDIIGGSATAGLTATKGSATGTAVVNGEGLGVCVKAGAQEGSSGNYFAGVLVSPQ